MMVMVISSIPCYRMLEECSCRAGVEGVMGLSDARHVLWSCLDMAYIYT